MIVSCDQCGTKFKLPDDKLKPGGVKVRCTKCSNIFEVPGPGSSPPPEPAPPEQPAGADGSNGGIGNDDMGLGMGDDYDFDMDDGAGGGGNGLDAGFDAGLDGGTGDDFGDDLSSDFDSSLDDDDLTINDDFGMDDEAGGDSLLDDDIDIDDGAGDDGLLDDDFGMDNGDAGGDSLLDDDFGMDDGGAGGDSLLDDDFGMDDGGAGGDNLLEDDFGMDDGAGGDSLLDDDFGMDDGAGDDNLLEDDFGMEDGAGGDNLLDDDFGMDDGGGDDFSESLPGSDDGGLDDSLDMGFGDEELVTTGGDDFAIGDSLSFDGKSLDADFGFDDGGSTLPGDRIISGKKQGKRRSPLVVALVILLVLVAGVYVASTVFLDDGLGMLLTFVDDFGTRNVDPLEGLEVNNVSHYYINNFEAGKALVVEGIVKNNSEKVPRGRIQVLLTLYDANEASIGKYISYCGDVLSIEELERLSQEEISSYFNQPQGDGLRVDPGASVPFMLVIFNLPENTGGYNVVILNAENVGG